MLVFAGVDGVEELLKIAWHFEETNLLSYEYLGEWISSFFLLLARRVWRSLKWDFVVEYDVWKMIVMLSSERFGDEFFWAFFLLQWLCTAE